MSAAGRTSADRAARRPLGRVLPRARRFLRARARSLALLGGWSLLESAQTFVGGYSVARALDDGFLAGRTSVGLVWLAVGAVAVVAGGLGTRGVFRHLADVVEPLRDGLVRRVVARALAEAVRDPARADGSAVSRLTSQTEIARDGFAGLLLVSRSFVFTAAGALFGLAALAPALLLVVVPPLAAGLLLFCLTLGPTAACQQRFLRADEAFCAQAGGAAAGLRDVVACGAQARTGARTEALAGSARDAARALARWAAARSLALGVAGELPVLLLLVCTPWLLRQGVTAGELVGALAYLTQALLPALHTLITAVGGAGTRLLVVLDRLTGGTDPPLPSPPPSLPVSAPPARVTPAGQRPPQPAGTPAAFGPPAVELRGVTFAYGPRADPVLRDLDLSVPPGRTLAVVGPSGIGKSTLACLVAGLLEPVAGEVRVGGAPVRGMPAKPPDRYAGRPAAQPGMVWQRVLIPQEAYVFSGSVRENLVYLCPGGGPPEAVVSASVAAVGLEPVVRRLGGLDAPVDPAALSRGERQLVALARAHLSPAPLVLLDEATCHLDPVAEARAEEAFLRRPGTLLVVAHRMSSARRADRVLVLDGTRASCGTHEELLEVSALYRELTGSWHARG